VSILDVLYSPLDRLQESVEAKGLETPMASWLRLYSDRHWFLGSLLFVTPTTLLLAVLLGVLSDRIAFATVILFAACLFVAGNAFMMSYYRWRVAHRRSDESRDLPTQ
jgi:hypothetical protein